MQKPKILVLTALLSLLAHTLSGQERTLTFDTQNLTNVTPSGTLLTSNSTSSTWTAGGYSYDELNYATDGYAQVTVNQLATWAVFGLSEVDANENQMGIEFGIYLHSSNNIYIMEDGVQQTISTSYTYAVGDILRVERVGDQIIYKRIRSGSTVVVHTSAKKTLTPLIVDFSLRDQNTTLDNVEVSDSFHTSSSHPSTTPVQNLTWADEVNLDYFGNKLIKVYLDPSEILPDPDPQDPEYTEAELDAATKYNAGAVSNDRLIPGQSGWVSATIYESSESKAFGLSSVSVINTQSGDNTQANDIDYAIILGRTGLVGINEFGSAVTVDIPQVYSPGDVFKVERNANGEIKYTRNSTLFHTSTVQSSSNLYARVALKSKYSTLMNIEISSTFTDPNVPITTQHSVDWTDIVGLSFYENEIIAKDGTSGWGNSGAASVAKLKPGVAGWVEMTVFETNTARTLGLSETNLDADVASIDYGLQLTANGDVKVIEGGSIILTHSPKYAKNEVFKIERNSAGHIIYSRTPDGGSTTVMHTNFTAPNTQLVVDIALKESSATFKNIQISESFEYPLYAGGFWSKNGNTVYYLDNVAIGRDAIIDDYKLTVEGKILTQGVKVTATGWADFVFEDNYDLKSLEYVKQFIQQNNHLPDVPSEAEVLKEGVDLNAMDATLLRKIEELTLYLIKQNEQLSEQNKKIEQLEEELKKIKKNNQ